MSNTVFSCQYSVASMLRFWNSYCQSAGKFTASSDEQRRNLDAFCCETSLRRSRLLEHEVMATSNNDTFLNFFIENDIPIDASYNKRSKGGRHISAASFNRPTLEWIAPTGRTRIKKAGKNYHAIMIPDVKTYDVDGVVVYELPVRSSDKGVVYLTQHEWPSETSEFDRLSALSALARTIKPRRPTTSHIVIPELNIRKTELVQWTNGIKYAIDRENPYTLNSAMMHTAYTLSPASKVLSRKLYSVEFLSTATINIWHMRTDFQYPVVSAAFEIDAWRPLDGEQHDKNQ